MYALADREILDLFRDRPDLLAVADAVATTQPRTRLRAQRRRLVRFSLVPAVAVVAAVVLLVVAAPWNGSRHNLAIDKQLFLQRALAVVGTRPVVHFTMQYADPGETVVDLSTGAERSPVHRNEFWFDSRTRQLRARMSIDRGEVVDYSSRFSVPQAQLESSFLGAFTGFATQYRDALAHGRARILGQTEVGGRPAVQIAFTVAPTNAVTQVVTVDAETYKPLTVTFGPVVMHVLAVESLPYDASLFTHPFGANAGPSAGFTPGEEITLDTATGILRGTPLGLGYAPDSIRRGDMEMTTTAGRTTHRPYVELSYGDLRMSLIRAPIRSLLGGFFTSPPSGSVAVLHGGNGAVGFLSRDGFFVQIHGSTEAEVLYAARQLEPLRFGP